MRYTLLILFIILFADFGVFSQNTVIDDVPWHSDTIGMWGASSSAWSLNQVDTLADITVGPYGDSYSMVYDIPFPISDSVGVIFDYGAYLDMQLIFAMTGWDNGCTKINYPTRITMDFPPDGTFANGAWGTIPSEYREQDTIVHPTTDTENWDIYADWPSAGKIELFINIEMEAHADLIYSDPSDPFNITWDTMHVFDPIDIDIDTFDIFLADLANNEYVIPWVDYHTDPITGATVIDSVYFLHDSIGWPMQFPTIFYDLIGISGDISIPDIQNYVKWIENEQRLYTWGNDEYLHINLDIIKFLQVTTQYLSNIPSMSSLAGVSQALEYEEGDTSIYIFTDPISGEDFTADLAWDLIDAELLFTNTMNQTLSFEDNQEYTFFGIPIGPEHYPNVWNVFEFPINVDYNVLDTLGVVVESGTSDSIKFCADYDLQLRLPCSDYDTLPVTVTHTIDPWLTNMVRDSIDVDFYLKVLDIQYSIGTASDPMYTGSFLLFEDTFNLGTIAGPPLFGPPIFMPWLIDGFFIDTTFVPDVNIIPDNNPLSDSLIFTDVLCYGTTTGSVTIIGSGGVQPYTYVWADETGTIISTNNTINNIGIGSYYVTITDANDCEVQDSLILINTNTEIIVSHTTTDVLCFGDSTGTANMNVSGGTPPYQFTWSPNVGNTQNVTNLYDGTYFVTVTDDVGCSVFDTITIINLFEPLEAITLQITDVTCYAGSDGVVDIDITGGEAPYSYIWSNGDITQDLNNVPANDYTVTVTDNSGCTIIHNVTVNEPPQMFITPNASPSGICPTFSSTLTATGAVTYEWSPATGLSSTTGSSVTASPMITTTYTVIGTNDVGCTASADVTVTVFEVPTSDFTISSIPCFADTATVTYTGTGNTSCTFNWNWGNANVSTGVGIGPHYANWLVDNYQSVSLVVVSQEGCVSDETTVSVLNPTLLTSNVSHTNILCNGEQNGTLSITGVGGTTPYTYEWNIGSDSANVGGLYAGTYQVTVTDANACVTVNETTVIEPNEFIISSTENFGICMGDVASIEISATGGTLPYTYYWNGVQSNPNIDVNTTVDTTLIASAIDASGCESNVSTTSISISPKVNLALSQNTDELCSGDPLEINASITGGVQPFVITDDEGNIYSNPINFYPSQTGTYNITVVDACGTKDSEQFDVTVNPSPEISLSADINSGCVPLIVNFNNNSTVVGNSYLWSFGDGLGLSTIHNPIHIYKTPGSFDVQLTVVSDKGCVNSQTLTNYITVWPKPEAKFMYSPLVPTFIDPEVTFTNLSEGANAYYWNFGDGATSNIVNPIHSYQNTGEYMVNLVSISSFGCKDTVNYLLEVKEGYTFYAPTAFSPDHDDINNDFYVMGIGIVENDFELIVYDRWGGIVWQTNKFDETLKQSARWNGFTDNNNVVPSGVYKWLAKFKDFNGVSHEESGNVTVIR